MGEIYDETNRQKVRKTFVFNNITGLFFFKG